MSFKEMKTFECHTCGHKWLEGKSGSHDCAVLLLEQLEQYKSIVKTVDPDNLPKESVWAWCDEGLYLGRIEQNKYFNGLVIDNYYETLNDPTHYIEQKDLIKMISGV